MARYPKQNFTEKQLKLIRENIEAQRPAVELYQTGLFGDMRLRTFYRRYKDEAVKMGRICTVVRKWTEEEEKTLSEMIVDGVKPGDMVLGFDDRSKGSVIGKAKMSGVYEARINPLWTEEEKDRLLALLDTISYSELVKGDYFPGRTKAAVRNQIARLRKRREK